MSIQSAQHYGERNRYDRFGHALLANDGNGDMTDEAVTITTLRHFSKEELPPLVAGEPVGEIVDRAVKLNDIEEMRAQMAMSPLEGDMQINALLDLDRQLIMTGKIDRELITDLYPDIEEYMFELLMEHDATAEAVGEIIDPVAETKTINIEFPDSPEDVLDLLELLSAQEADKVLAVLIEQGMVQQVDAIREDSADHSESPLVAA